MSKYYDEPGVQMMHRVFNTAEVIRRRDVAGNSHDEKIADSLIEQ